MNVTAYRSGHTRLDAECLPRHAASRHRASRRNRVRSIYPHLTYYNSTCEISQGLDVGPSRTQVSASVGLRRSLASGRVGSADFRAHRQADRAARISRPRPFPARRFGENKAVARAIGRDPAVADLIGSSTRWSKFWKEYSSHSTSGSAQAMCTPNSRKVLPRVTGMPSSAASQPIRITSVTWPWTLSMSVAARQHQQALAGRIEIFAGIDHGPGRCRLEHAQALEVMAQDGSSTQRSS